MLETGHAALLPEPTKNAGLIRDPDIAEFIRDITDKYLRVGNYDPESMTSCLEFTKVLDTSDKLCEYMDAFEVQVYEKRVMTFDFEGPDQARQVLALQCLGSASVVIHLSHIKEEMERGRNMKLPEEREGVDHWFKLTFRPLVKAVFSGKVIVLGSDILKDAKELKTLYSISEHFEDIDGNREVLVDTKWLFSASKVIGTYHEDVVKFLDKRKVQEGLGPISLATNSYNHKPFSIDQMTTYMGLNPKISSEKEMGRREWKKLDSKLKHGVERPTASSQDRSKTALIYDWRKWPLDRSQIFYAHLDVVTPLRLLLQFAQKAAHSKKLSLRFHDVTAFLDEALCHASQICHATVNYKGLDPDHSAPYDHEEMSLKIDEAATTRDETHKSDQPAENSQREDDGELKMNADQQDIAFFTDDPEAIAAVASPPPAPSTSGTKTSFTIPKKTPLNRTNDRLLAIAHGAAPEKAVSALGKKRETVEKKEKEKRRHDRSEDRKEERGEPSAKRSRDRSRDRSRERSRRSRERSKDRSSVRYDGRSQDKSDSRRHRDHDKKSSSSSDRKTESADTKKKLDRQEPQKSGRTSEKSQERPKSEKLPDLRVSLVRLQSSSGSGSRASKDARDQRSPSSCASKEARDQRSPSRASKKARVTNHPPAQITHSVDNSEDQVSKSITGVILESTLALQAFQSGQPKAEVLKNLHNAATLVDKARCLLGTGVYERLGVQEQEDVEMIEDPIDPKAGKISSEVIKAAAEVEVEKNKKPTDTKNDQNRVLTEEQLESAIMKNKSLRWAINREDFATKYNVEDPDRSSVRERFKDASFEFDPDGLRSLDRKDVHFPIDHEPQLCRHRAPRPNLSRQACSHCGLKHSNPQECAIFRFHQGADLLSSDKSVLAQFPCSYCESSLHTTRMCKTLHSFCKTCQVRGHRPININGIMLKRKKKTGACHIADFPEKVALFTKERFDHFSGLGYKTGGNNSKWGYRIDGHRCSSGAEFSDSEAEN